MNVVLDEKQKSIFYYGLEFSQSANYRYLAKLKTAQIIDWVMVGMAGIGLLGLGCHLIFVWPTMIHLPFYEQKSIFLLIFYLSTWADGYLLSRYFKRHGLGSNKIVYLYRRGIEDITKRQAIYSAFNPEIIQLIQESFTKTQLVTPLALARSLLYCGCFHDLALRLNLNTAAILASINQQLSQTREHDTSGVQQALKEAFFYGLVNDFQLVDTECLLAGLYYSNHLIREIFFTHGMSESEFTDCLKWRQIDRQVRQQNVIIKQNARLKKIGSVNAAYTSSATPLINQVGDDLTALSKAGRLPLCLGRDQEIARLFQHFQSGKSGLLLVGAEKIGKQSIINGLAQAMVQEKVPEVLFDKRLIQLDFNKLISHPQLPPDQLLIKIFAEAKEAGNIVFSLTNLAALIINKAANQDGSNFDLAGILSSHLEAGLKLITTCNPDDYARLIAHTDLAVAMDKIEISPPNQEATLLMLQAHTSGIEDQYQLQFSFAALKAAIELTVRYQPTLMLPQKAISVLKLAAAKKQALCRSTPQKDCLLDASDIAQVISEQTKIPSQNITSDEKQQLLNLEKLLQKEIVGQDEAINSVAGALRRARADLQQNQQQPLASFLFLGPTGVGKTALALATAKHFFGANNQVIRLDMSEYQQVKDSEKLLGSSDGQTPGQLITAVQAQPFSLILFDEIEKAHPDILNLFLQILDEGRLTSGSGETASFADTIIVATSNAAAGEIQTAIANHTPYDELKKQLLSSLLFTHFRPEFINRFDEVVVFRPLEKEQVVQIVQLAINKIQASLNPKGIRISITPQASQKIAQENYLPQYGARNIQHYLKNTFENQIATLIINGQLARRDQVVIDDNLNLVVHKAASL